MPREKIILECNECKSRNYFTDKNRRSHPERVGGKRLCPRHFVTPVTAEMKKLSWPTQAELVKATRMVVILSLVIGLALGLLDKLLSLILVDGVAALAR